MKVKAENSAKNIIMEATGVGIEGRCSKVSIKITIITCGGK